MSTTWFVHFEPGVDDGTFARGSTAYELRDVFGPETPSVDRCMFGYPIHSDGATLAGGDWEATLPLSNLKTRDTTERARSSNDSTSATQITIDLGADPLDWLIGAICLFEHSLTKNALIRITGSDESDLDPPVYESGWVNACPEIYPFGVLKAGEPGFDDGRPGDTQPNIPVIQLPPEGCACRYWLIEIDDTANPDGYVEIGRLIMAPLWDLGQNFEVGSALDVQTLTTRDVTDGATLFHDERPQRLAFMGSFSAIDEDVALVRMHDFRRLVGTSRQFLFIEKPASAYHLHRGAFPAVMEKLSPLQYPAAHLRRETAVAVIEEL